MLTLSPPAPRDTPPPFAGLLAETCADPDALRRRRRGALFGPPVLFATTLDAAHPVDGPLWLRLDTDVDALPATLPDLARIEVDCPFDHLDDALALAQGDPHPLPARLAIHVDPGSAGRGWAAESAERIVAAGAHPVLGPGLAPADVADFLAVLAHAETGFVARARTGGEVVAILAATVAALRGDDIPSAYTAADPGPVAALGDAASAAVREVLLAVAVPDAGAVETHLRAHGITADPAGA